MNVRPSVLHLSVAALVIWLLVGGTTTSTWGGQGHRLVAQLAANRLTPIARQNVEWLLGPQSLADVSIWADQYLEGNNQTSFWHYLNIPPDAARYDRDRDCPRQPGVAAGGRGDRWRDCAVDRIAYNQERLADTSLDRADRAIALKFLVHFVGDIHQPFHALGVERGGNGILVSVFGSPTCGSGAGAQVPCNLHSVWDSQLIAHRNRDDRRYLEAIERTIATKHLQLAPIVTPADWAMESHGLAQSALLPQQANADERYFERHISAIDERLAMAGIRLAALLNQSLPRDPPMR